MQINNQRPSFSAINISPGLRKDCAKLFETEFQTPITVSPEAKDAYAKQFKTKLQTLSERTDDSGLNFNIRPSEQNGKFVLEQIETNGEIKEIGSQWQNGKKAAAFIERKIKDILFNVEKPEKTNSLKKAMEAALKTKKPSGEK